ncbi:DUF1289 domain-containing protein [Methylobacterium soli]|uniref:DUF1289 domain-containing protein n=1 Tax=Methylobacterium soli TaxID=553447 RepID=A0A6L3T3G2_9HYPH|nr:DUF1289 domain-containing protein [Methylobacterium soli]KAB1081367.1 DUF1289 domain-containing protein [Methylobacterium soli]GJE42475.1 hypothetical protein AEGHOMDF_1647 [Methylobacterium soli]
MNLPPRPKPSSPCTKVCVLDAATGLCEGCGRTRDEIALWGSLSEAQRRSIMAGLEARLQRAYLEGAEVPAAT